VEDGAQPFEQPLRRQVSEWITAGIGPIREVQADDGAPRPHVSDVHHSEFSAFESPKPRVAGAGCVGARAETEPGCGPRLEVLAAQPSGRVSCASPAAIARAFAGRHRRSVVLGPARSVDRRSPAAYRSLLRGGAQATGGRQLVGHADRRVQR
jgi:hypothetical protein